jgi:hypothetical protein
LRPSKTFYLPEFIWINNVLTSFLSARARK